MTKRTQAMNLDRFRGLLDAYGAEAGRWPEEDRDAANALLGASQDARALLNEATVLDGALDALEAPAPSPALTEQIEGLVHEPRDAAAAPRMRPSLGQRLRAWRAAWRPAVLAASGALGLAVGLAAAQTQPTTTTFDTLELSALAGGLTDLRAAELFEDQ